MGTGIAELYAAVISAVQRRQHFGQSDSDDLEQVHS